MFGELEHVLITAYDQPALGCVYKLVAIEDENGEMVPTVKIF